MLVAAGAAAALVLMSLGALWWRLSQGPIELDVVTPWLVAAIEDNFGGKHTVTVGGTQIERDENGGTSLRLRDIVVRDADGTVVASAPKAEVGLSGFSLLRGQMRAQSLNLVGAEMSVRIENDGRVTVFAGADKRPIATALPASTPPAAPRAESAKANAPAPPLGGELADVAGLLAWIDGLGATGLDGHDLRELGLKNGHLVVDDRRNGKHWTFDRINASLRRPERGGIVFRLESDNPRRPWVLSAALRPLGDGLRAVGIEARQVSIRDLLLALRVKEGDVDADLPLSASIRAEIAADGTLRLVQGQLLVGAGTIVDRGGSQAVTIPVDHGDVRFSWDAGRRLLVVPFQVQSAGNQYTMRATVEAPADNGGVWRVAIGRNDPVIDPVILGPLADDEGISLNHVNIRARLDTVRRRLDIEQGDVGRIDTRPLHNVGFAVTGSVDYSTPDPHVAFGVAATRMPIAVMRRLWPVLAAAHLRKWVGDHVSSGIVERIVIAGNAPLSTFASDGPPTPDDGLSIDLETSATTLKPVADLPAIRDADLTAHITGRTATVNLGRGTVEVAPGRKLSIANGVFRVADTHQKPAVAHVQFRLDGGVPAAAMLLQNNILRDEMGLALDPESSRGTVATQVALDLPLSREQATDAIRYVINAELASFAADKMLMGQKLEAASLQVTADNAGFQVKGDVKINGIPAAIVLSRQKSEPDALLQLEASLDEAARRRLGINLGTTVAGSIPVKVSGRVGDSRGDDRFALEADLTPVAIDDLLPGWQKPAGKAARFTATLTRSEKTARFDDIAISGSGANVKGSAEVDNAGDLVSANLPVFALSSGDKMSLKAERGGDGALRVTMRGDVYDGRNFVKSVLAGPAADAKRTQKPTDLDLDVKIGAVAGYNGETLRGLELKLTRRSGRIRVFTLKAKIGRDAPLNGDLRLRARDHHQVVYLETSDAGALFRFTDMYPRMFGGRMWLAMDPPTQDHSPQIGHLYIGDFVVRGEQALERVVAGAPGQPHAGVEFTELRCDFTRTPGLMTVRDGVVRGPLVGATIEGSIDYLRDDVHLRGTFVPFYGLNNMFGQIPIVGLFLGGGSNEGLVGVAYEAVGPPSAPRISVNIATAIAPGLLRKFVPNPGAFDPNAYQPER
ncbi:MAG: hypothetical protein IRY89_07695 [Pseudolabrys sp.]|nr:hypothetical protein [Pseudolabrys sp.]